MEGRDAQSHQNLMPAPCTRASPVLTLRGEKKTGKSTDLESPLIMSSTPMLEIFNGTSILKAFIVAHCKPTMHSGR